MKNAPPEEQAKFSKVQLRKLREVSKLVVFKNQPKEITFNPQVTAAKGPGYVQPVKKAFNLGQKAPKFHSPYLYMTLMSEIAGYKVHVIANTFEASNVDDDQEELKRQKAEKRA